MFLFVLLAAAAAASLAWGLWLEVRERSGRYEDRVARGRERRAAAHVRRSWFGG